MYKNFTDLVDFVGSRPKPFDDRKKYISTGALKTNNISEDDVEIIDYATRPSRANLEVKTGDILFAKMAFTDKRLLVGEIEANYIYSTGFYAVKPKDGILTTKCLYYLLSSQTFNNQKNANSSGATQKAITINGLKKLKLIVPEYNNQDRIGKILESVELIINNKKQQLQEFDHLIKSRFVEMFGTLENTKYNIDTLMNLSEFITDGTHQTPQYTDDTVSGYKFLSSKDVTSGKIDWSNIKYIPEGLHRELYNRIAPRRNDILLAKNGTTGKAALVDVDEVFDIYVSLAIIRLKDNSVNPMYILHAINSIDTKRQFNASLKGVGVPNLHLGEIRKTKIIVPDIELQNEFVETVKQIDKLKFAVQQSLNETQQLFDSLMQEYFG